MKVKFLGTHNAESKNTRLVSLLIDEVLSIDTGCITSELSYIEQEKVKAILLTHGHYDHIRGVPAFAFNNYCKLTPVYATQPALDMLSSNLIDGVIYPKFTETTPMCDEPSLELITLKPNRSVNIEGYRVLPLSVNHKLGAVGFEITAKNGKKLFFTGDTGHDLSSIWKKITPDVLIIEVTFPDSREQTAIDAQHLCPKMLHKELQNFKKIKGYFPRVILIHLCPKLEEEIREDVNKVAKDLDLTIEIAVEGLQINV